jgi:hypothetical protein
VEDDGLESVHTNKNKSKKALFGLKQMGKKKNLRTHWKRIEVTGTVGNKSVQIAADLKRLKQAGIN